MLFKFLKKCTIQNFLYIGIKILNCKKNNQIINKISDREINNKYLK